MDYTYNYLIGKHFEDFPVDFDLDNRFDSDSCCKKLYDDLILAFFSNTESFKYGHSFSKIENREQQFGKKAPFFTLFVNEGQYLLSSDYIGPSVCWARKAKMKDEEINGFLKTSRTIGGHMLWPRGFEPTINQARGGENGFYDRIDWTLAAIEIFYCSEAEEDFIRGCNEFLPDNNAREDEKNKKRFTRIYSALYNSKKWLDEFTFESFCDFFKLTGSFVTEEYKVIELAPLFPILPHNFREYSRNNIKAIEIRNKKIAQHAN